MRRSLFVAFSMGFAVVVSSAEASADEATPPPEGHPAAVTAPPKRSFEDAEEITVELRANDGRATLERRKSTTSFSGLALPDLAIGGLTEWETVCVAPCAMPVSTRSTYRVAGDGLVPSSTFALPRTPHLRLDADLGSSRSRISGALLGIAGAGALVLGASASIASPILAANDVGGEALHTGLLAGGIGTVAVGAVLLAVGIGLYFTNESTLRFDPTPTSRTDAKRTLLPNGFVF